MLSSKMTATLLYVAPSLRHLAETYNQKIKYIMSFDRNIDGSVADVIFEEIFKAREKVDNILALSEAIETAVGLLKPVQREVIELIYFRGFPKEEAAKRLGIDAKLVSSRRTYAFGKLRVYIEMLGFTEGRVLEYFNSERIFIDICERVCDEHSKSSNFHMRSGNAER